MTARSPTGECMSVRTVWPSADRSMASGPSRGRRLHGALADLVVALLAVLKAGGAYCRSIPPNPAERDRVPAGDAVRRAVLTAGQCTAGSRGDFGVGAEQLSHGRSHRHDDPARRAPRRTGRRHDRSRRAERAAVAGPPGLCHLHLGRPAVKGRAVTHHNVWLCSPRPVLVRVGYGTSGAGSTPTLSTSPSGSSWARCCTAAVSSSVPFQCRVSPEAFWALLEASGQIPSQTPQPSTSSMVAEPDRQRDACASLRAVVFGGEALDPGRLREMVVARDGGRPTHATCTASPRRRCTSRPASSRQTRRRGQRARPSIPACECSCSMNNLSPVPSAPRRDVHRGGSARARLPRTARSVGGASCWSSGSPVRDVSVGRPRALAAGGDWSIWVGRPAGQIRGSGSSRGEVEAAVSSRIRGGCRLRWSFARTLRGKALVAVTPWAVRIVR